jgi:hypothetical protein
MINLKDAYKNLRDYQDSFRKIFDQYIKSGDEKNYNELEAKEIKNFNTLLPTWYQFAHFPKTTFSSSPRLKENYINSYLPGQLKKLTDCLSRYCVDDYCIKGCFETIIDGENSVVFQCDLKSPNNVDESLRKTEKALFRLKFNSVKVQTISYSGFPEHKFGRGTRFSYSTSTIIPFAFRCLHLAK